MSTTLNDIHPQANIGENVNIGSFTHIGPDVSIGDGTEIGPNVSIFGNTSIGENCKIFPGAVIGAAPQDLKYKGEKTRVEIGDNTVIRECVTINLGTTDRQVTKVGDHCLVMAYVHIAHDTWVGNHCILANSVQLAGHVTIEDWAILEGLVAVQQFLTIGAHTFIAGASLVRKNVPPFIKAGREPLGYIGVNSVGLQRRGFSNEIIRQIEDLYRLLYVHNTNVSKGLIIAESDIPYSKEKLDIIDFINNSEKGVIRGSR